MFTVSAGRNRAGGETNVSEIERALHALAAESGLRLTLYDLSGVFIDPGTGNGLVHPEWNTHTYFPVCRDAYRQDLNRCVCHCREQTNGRAAAVGNAIVHECPLGLVEVAVPLFSNGRFLGSLFAGQWRVSGAVNTEIQLLAEAAQEDYRGLAEFDAEKGKRIADLLTAFGQGLLRMAEEQPAAVLPSSPSLDTVILHYVKDNVAEQVSVADLARYLHLSKSRTCHLVKERFGISFGDLIWREKMNLARSLLLAPGTLRLAEIAQRIGIESEYHFSRRFRKTQGISPGKYRKIHGASGSA